MNKKKNQLLVPAIERVICALYIKKNCNPTAQHKKPLPYESKLLQHEPTPAQQALF